MDEYQALRAMMPGTAPANPEADVQTALTQTNNAIKYEEGGRTPNGATRGAQTGWGMRSPRTWDWSA